ncbi:hypothetical protein EDD37DRAFT_603476 [Exophiala viscosa]|uniref:uncharacterized protein n=1 Tax=Exophiala viscosa TaxID=2486360 RepID=UPI00219853BB|nr:hypothetical protein EDD37DRAFT_603476 [Exophiala viscosa]
MEDKSGEREKHQVIVARTPSSTQWTDIIKKNKTGNAKEPPLFRHSIEFTLREQSSNSAPQVGTARYLVVGYAKPNLDKVKYRTSQPGVTKQIVGLHRPSEVLLWEDDEHPTVYVVTPIQDTQPDQLKFYVLLKPENEICSAYAPTLLGVWSYCGSYSSLYRRARPEEHYTS